MCVMYFCVGVYMCDAWRVSVCISVCVQMCMPEHTCVEAKGGCQVSCCHCCHLLPLNRKFAIAARWQLLCSPGAKLPLNHEQARDL